MRCTKEICGVIKVMGCIFGVQENLEEEYIDGEVNLEAKLISSLEEIDRYRENNINKKEKLQKYE
jgi:hypothetical protein